MLSGKHAVDGIQCHPDEEHQRQTQKKQLLVRVIYEAKGKVCSKGEGKKEGQHRNLVGGDACTGQESAKGTQYILESGLELINACHSLFLNAGWQRVNVKMALFPVKSLEFTGGGTLSAKAFKVAAEESSQAAGQRPSKATSSNIRKISSRKERQQEALLVLPGIGYGPSGMKAMERLHARLDSVDVYVPDYIKKSGIRPSVESVMDYMDLHGLDGYDRLHVFCFIAGGFILHDLLRDRPLRNLSSLILDRSPYQERAPRIVTRRIPGVARLLLGSFVFELAERSYPDYHASLLPEGVRPGLMIESRRTLLLKLFSGTAREMGPLQWKPSDIQPGYLDYCMVPYHHDSIYSDFDELAEPISQFIKYGTFGDEVDRTLPEE